MKWYCLNTSPAREAQVASYLEKTLSLQTYCPRIIQEKISSRGVRSEVAGPLFPRYLFCRFDLAAQYHAVRSAPEVIDFIRAGAHPAEVSDGMIKQLHSLAGEAVDVTYFEPGGSTGARVEITPLDCALFPADLLQDKSDRDRVSILKALLEGSDGKESSMKVEIKNL